MPKQITKTVYTFKELLEGRESNLITFRAVDKAREWLIQGVNDFGTWSEYTLEVWKQSLEQIGFESPDIAYSGFGSQGDGASFTSKSVDMAKLIGFMATEIKPSQVIAGEPEDFRPWLVWKANGKSPANRQYRRIPPEYVNATVERHNHQYCHENTCRFSVSLDGSTRKVERMEKILNSFESDVEHLRRDLCRAIYHDLEDEYTYQTSDEQLAEDSEANEYTFDENGRRE